jgi:F-type H+-transporting ATPase subunit b
MELLQEAEFWVGVGVVIFLGILVWAKVPSLVAKTLDDKAAAIQAELDEAKRIRAEAESLLAQLKAERAEAERHSVEMIKAAEDEAKRLSAEASVKLEELVVRRKAIAERKIAQAEAQAHAEIKAAAVDAAALMAENILAARAAGAKSDASIDLAIKDMAAKLQ